MKKTIEQVKVVADTITTVGIGAIVGNIITATTPAGGAWATTMCIRAGALVLIGLVGDKSTNYLNEKIDQVVEETEKAVEKAKQKAKEDAKK